MSPDISDDSISDPEPVEQDVVSLVTVNAYIDVSVIESTAYNITNLGLSRGWNYYLGRVDFEGLAQRNRASFSGRTVTWRDPVTKATRSATLIQHTPRSAITYAQNGSIHAVCILFVNISEHAIVRAQVRRLKTEKFFDTLPSPYNESRALPLY